VTGAANFNHPAWAESSRAAAMSSVLVVAAAGFKRGHDILIRRKLKAPGGGMFFQPLTVERPARVRLKGFLQLRERGFSLAP
jgi:hypothetical protein